MTSGTTVWVVVVVAMLTQMVGDLGVHVAFGHFASALLTAVGGAVALSCKRADGRGHECRSHDMRCPDSATSDAPRPRHYFNG